MVNQTENKIKRPTTVLICINRRLRSDQPSCASRGSYALADEIEKGLLERNIPMTIERSVCLGQCQKGPTIRLVPGGKFYLGMELNEIGKFLDDLEEICFQII